MLINTSNNTELHRNGDDKAQQRDKMRVWVEAQTQNAMYLDDPTTSPANALARMGQPLQAVEIERRLKKLNASLHFEFNEFNSTKKMIYLVDRRGKTALFPYEAGVMPERSIMNVKVEEVPVNDLFDNPKFVMNRKDFGKEGNPYVNRVVIPWSERTRGWRTILIKLVMSGVLTPNQVEVEFGVHNTAEWQNSLGKARHQLPW